MTKKSENTYFDDRLFRANTGALKSLHSKASRMADYWERLITTQPLTAEHYALWVKDINYVYHIYEQENIAGGMNKVVWDSLPEATRRPPMESALPTVSRVIPSRMKYSAAGALESITHAEKPVRREVPGTFARVHEGATDVLFFEREGRLFVSLAWLEWVDGRPTIPEGTEDKIRDRCVTTLSNEESEMIANIQSFANTWAVLQRRGAKKLPIRPGGGIDVSAILHLVR